MPTKGYASHRGPAPYYYSRRSPEAGYAQEPEMLLLQVEKIHITTDKAYGIKDANGQVIFLPKSQCRIKKHSVGLVELEVASWLSKKNPSLVFTEE